MSPADLDRLRDEMTIRLMEATSSDTALQRVRVEVDVGYPVYDPDPGSNLRNLQPRDVIRRCDNCGRVHVEAGEGTAKRFCSTRCRVRAKYVRDRDARLAATTGARAAS